MSGGVCQKWKKLNTSTLLGKSLNTSGRGGGEGALWWNGIGDCWAHAAKKGADKIQHWGSRCYIYKKDGSPAAGQSATPSQGAWSYLINPDRRGEASTPNSQNTTRCLKMGPGMDYKQEWCTPYNKNPDGCRAEEREIWWTDRKVCKWRLHGT